MRYTSIVLVLRALLFSSLLIESFGVSQFATYFRNQRQGVKRLFSVTRVSRCNASELNQALSNIVVRMNVEEEKRIRMPLSDVITDIFTLVTTNGTMSEERKAAYSGHMLHEFIQNHINDDNDGFSFARINRWGAVIDLVSLRHVLDLEAAIQLLSTEPTTNRMPLREALKQHFKNFGDPDTKPIADALDRFRDNKTATFPKKLRQLYGHWKVFIKDHPDVDEVEAGGYGALKFFSQALHFYETVHSADDVFEKDLPLHLSDRLKKITQSSLAKSLTPKVVKFSSTLTNYFKTNADVTARIQHFLSEMWTLFQSDNRRYNMFRLMGSEIYMHLYRMAFRENYAWGEDNSMSLTKPGTEEIDHFDCAKVLELVKPDAQKKTIFVESIIRDAINPFPANEKQSRLMDLVTRCRNAINDKSEPLRRYQECVRITRNSGMMSLLGDVHFNGWNGSVKDFCNCEKEVTKKQQEKRL